MAAVRQGSTELAGKSDDGNRPLSSKPRIEGGQVDALSFCPEHCVVFDTEEFAHGMPHDRRAYKVAMALTSWLASSVKVRAGISVHHTLIPFRLPHANRPLALNLPMPSGSGGARNPATYQSSPWAHLGWRWIPWGSFLLATGAIHRPVRTEWCIKLSNSPPRGRRIHITSRRDISTSEADIHAASISWARGTRVTSHWTARANHLRDAPVLQETTSKGSTNYDFPTCPQRVHHPPLPPNV